MHFHLNETGRSMVEMLGVLAVIGVLSVGGIAGYTTAMNRYRTNETINELNIIAHIISQARIRGGQPILSELGYGAAGEEFSNKFGYQMEYTTGASQFAIDIQVPNAICRAFFSIGYKQPFGIVTTTEVDGGIAGDTDPCGTDDMVPITLYYTNDLSPCSGCEIDDDIKSTTDGGDEVIDVIDLDDTLVSEESGAVSGTSLMMSYPDDMPEENCGASLE